MKTALALFAKAVLDWLWRLVMGQARREVRAEQVVEEIQNDTKLADQAEALTIERAAASVPRELPADRIDARRGRRPSTHSSGSSGGGT